MPAPTYGSSYMEVAAPLTGNPVTAAELTPQLDPVFETAWQASKLRCPEDSEGDLAFKMWAADLSYRFKAGGTFVPAISGISPTTGVHAVAFTLTVNGSNFSAGATVNFNGVDLPGVTTNTAAQLVVPVPASLIPIAGTYPVKVRNSDGSATAATNFTAT